MDIRTNLPIIPGSRIERDKKHLLVDIPLPRVVAELPTLFNRPSKAIKPGYTSVL